MKKFIIYTVIFALAMVIPLFAALDSWLDAYRIGAGLVTDDCYMVPVQSEDNIGVLLVGLRARSGNWYYWEGFPLVFSEGDKWGGLCEISIVLGNKYDPDASFMEWVDWDGGEDSPPGWPPIEHFDVVLEHHFVPLTLEEATAMFPWEPEG